MLSSVKLLLSESVILLAVGSGSLTRFVSNVREGIANMNCDGENNGDRLFATGKDFLRVSNVSRGTVPQAENLVTQEQIGKLGCAVFEPIALLTPHKVKLCLL